MHSVYVHNVNLSQCFVIDVIRSFYSFLIRCKAATGKDTDTTEMKLMSVGRNLQSIFIVILIV